MNEEEIPETPSFSNEQKIRLALVTVLVFGTLSVFVNFLQADDGKTIGASSIWKVFSKDLTISSIKKASTQKTEPQTAIFKTKGEHTTEKERNTFTIPTTTYDPKISIIHAGDPNIFKITPIKNKLIEAGYKKILKADSNIGTIGATVYFEDQELTEISNNIQNWIEKSYPHIKTQNITSNSKENLKKALQSGELQNIDYSDKQEFNFDLKKLYTNSTDIIEVSDIVIVIGY